MAKLSAYFKHMGFIRGIILKNKLSFLVIITLNVIVGALGLLIPVISKLQIEQLQNSNQEMFGLLYSSPLNLFIVLVFILSLVRLGQSQFEQITTRMRRKIDFQSSIVLEQKLLKKLETFDISFLNNPKNNSISDSVFSATYFFSDFLSFGETIIRNIMSLGILPIVFFVDQTLFATIAVFGILEIIINFLWQHYNIKMDTILELQNSSRSQLRWSLLSSLDKLIPMNAQESLFERILQDKKTDFGLSLKLNLAKDRVQMLMNIFKEIPALIVVTLIAIRVFDGSATLGDFTMISMYTTQLGAIFSSLSWMLRDSQSLMIKMSRINFFFSLKERILAPSHEKSIKIQGSVEFRNLSFHYPLLDEEEKAYLKEVITLNEKMLDRIKSYKYEQQQMKRWHELLVEHDEVPKEILQGVNLTIRQGDITALVGRNGAGKTTSANLIVKGYSPSGGEILIDGININDFVPGDLRQQISMIHQTPLLLRGLSVRENLLLGVNKTVADAEIWEWLKKIDLKEVIAGLARGLDTIYGEETSFSGGQIQLLAIVRVILQDRKIVIFDEGTNQLDAEHEAIIMDILKSLKKKKTIFIITHKMTTARHSDKIYVMDQGRILEEGRHTALLQIPNGIYRKFWELQVIN